MLERLTHQPALLRRAVATVCAAMLAGGLLTGCGFYDATDRPYTPANGANDNPDDTEVAVLGNVVVSTEPGSGTFIATITNKDLVDEVALTSIAGADPDQPITADEFEPVQVMPGGHVNLADAPPIKLTGDFGAGDFVRLNLGFDNGDNLSIDMPVVPNSGYWADLDGPAPPPTEESEGTEG